MPQPIRILLQTTIPPLEDDWNITRFSMLREFLASRSDDSGHPLFEVTARDRHPDASGHDPVLSTLDRQGFDELWLFALDVGDGLSPQDHAGIMRFHQQGGGLFTTRDHQDMGLSMVPLENIGVFHHFHTQNRDPDMSRCSNDDCYTLAISFPNYHSGRNGDAQTITPLEPLHELLKRPDGSAIQYLPAHPHEGSVGVPEGMDTARAIAQGVSQVTGRNFTLIVVNEEVANGSGGTTGRLVAQSTFHHFCDYNWDPTMGCPSFVEEAPGSSMQTMPQAREDIHTYVHNLARWLAPGDR